MTRDEMIDKVERVQAFCDLMHSYAVRGLIEYADEEDIRYTAACRAGECTDVLAAMRAPAVTGEAVNLREWVRHKDDCECVRSRTLYGVTFGEGGRCTCGLREALAAPPAAGAPPATGWPDGNNAVRWEARDDVRRDVPAVESDASGTQEAPALPRGDADGGHTQAVGAPPALVALENIAMAARRGLAFGHQATPQTPERMIERKEQALGQILDVCERHGVTSSVLRGSPAPAPVAPPAETPDRPYDHQSGAANPARVLAVMHEMADLLRSACAIAERRGSGTAWERFIESVYALGLNGVTARTYRVLPHEVPAPVAPERCGYVHEDGWTCGRAKGHPSVHVPPSRMANPPAQPLREMQHAPRPDCDAEGWHLCAPPAVAGGDAPPEIQVGDWVREDGEDVRFVREQHQATALMRGISRSGLVEIRGERDGQPFIWRRRQEGQ